MITLESDQAKAIILNMIKHNPPTKKGGGIADYMKNEYNIEINWLIGRRHKEQNGAVTLTFVDARHEAMFVLKYSTYL